MADDGIQDETAEQARERRLQALRSLAQQQTSARSADAAAPTTPADAGDAHASEQPTRPSDPEPSRGQLLPLLARSPRRSARRRGWIGVACAAVLLIVVGGLVMHAHAGSGSSQSATGAGSAVVSIVTLHSGVDCPSTVAWSPDGKRIAVVGYAKRCPSEFPTNYQYEPGIVAIYDAATGRVLDTFQPDKAIHDTPGVPTPANVTPAASYADTGNQVVDYNDLLWSPDGKRLALRFMISTYSIVKSSSGDTIQPNGGLNGLEVVNVDGSAPHVLTYRSNSQNFGALRWDLTSGKATGINPVPANAIETSSFPPALSYSWSGDTLTPGTPLTGTAPPAAPALGPVGNPDGGASFTIWQPGGASYDNQAFVNNSSVTENPGAYVFSAGFVAWSPDGRYLLDSVYLQGLVLPQGRPAPSAKSLKDFGLDTAARLPMRDAGMQQAFESLATTRTTNGGASLTLAWRPDGQVLATQAQQQSQSQPYDSTITFYDCRTGAKLTTLKPTFALQGSDQGTGLRNALLWSPDGSHLLALDAQSAAITIWSGGKLPK